MVDNWRPRTLVVGGGWIVGVGVEIRLIYFGKAKNVFTKNESVNNFSVEVPLFYRLPKNNFQLTNNFNGPKNLQMQKIFYGNQFPLNQTQP